MQSRRFWPADQFLGRTLSLLVAIFPAFRMENDMPRYVCLLSMAALTQFGLGIAGVTAADPSPAAPITFNKDIASIVFQKCAVCHHPGEVAPFPLLSYSDVKKRARQIETVTKDRFMPPWKSVEGHGRFVGERRLTKEQIDLIVRWVEQGAVEG